MQDPSDRSWRLRPPRQVERTFGRRWLRLLLPLLLVVMPLGCRNSPAPGKLQVVASIEPLAYFVERIGGGRVSVSVMVPPGGDPHSYEPTPRQMAALGSAALFVKAGSGVEFELDWMPRFLSLNRGLRVCDASEGVRLMPMSQPDHDGHASRAGGYDPHFWLSPSNARLIAANVARSLALVDPAHRGEYEANRSKLDDELRVLDGELRQRLVVAKSRRFVVFHPAWGYFARDYGLEQIAAEHEGKSLTPVEMARVIEIAKASGIHTVFVSPQFSSAQAEAIARDIGGSTATLDPLARDYQENLRRAAQAISGGPP